MPHLAPLLWILTPLCLFLSLTLIMSSSMNTPPYYSSTFSHFNTNSLNMWSW